MKHYRLTIEVEILARNSEHALRRLLRLCSDLQHQWTWVKQTKPETLNEQNCIPIDHPPGTLSPLGERLFTLSKAAAEFANEQTESLNFGDYATVCEIETRLLAYGNLLESSEQEAFLEDELRIAEETLTTFRQWAKHTG